MAVNLKYIRVTEGDSSGGITISERHLVLCLLSLSCWVVSDVWLPHWICLQSLLTCYIMFDDKIYCDASLLWDGLPRLRGLTQEQAVKQATITQYLKYQNPSRS